MSLDHPSAALSIAFYRLFEVTLGTTSALLVAWLLAKEDPGAAAGPPPPGWRSMFGTSWPALMHALRSGVAVAMLPFLWNWLQLPSLTQVAVTVAAVMAVPALSDDSVNDRRKIAARGLHRLLGCLFGGCAGLAALSLSISELAPWLVVLSAGVWVAAHVQASARGVGYAGTQGAVVFIMTLVQNRRPAREHPAGDRSFRGHRLRSGDPSGDFIPVGPAAPPVGRARQCVKTARSRCDRGRSGRRDKNESFLLY